MSGQYIGEQVNLSENVGRTEPVTDHPVEDALPADTVQENETLNRDQPVTAAPPADGMAAQMAPATETSSYAAPASERNSPAAPASPVAAPSAALLNHDESEHFRMRWNEIQGKFVDEPRVAVQQADTLVAEVVAQITRMFGDEHNSLEKQWNQGNDVSTEDLRKIIQRYRSFFNRLVL